MGRVIFAATGGTPCLRTFVERITGGPDGQETGARLSKYAQPGAKVVSNAKTLADWALGRFAPESPRKGHVFVWGGERDLFGQLAAALTAGTSWLQLRRQTARETGEDQPL